MCAFVISETLLTSYSSFLQHTHTLHIRYEYRKEINKDNFLGTGGRLVTAYAELMKDMWLKDNTSTRVVHPSSFKKSLSTFAPQFGGFRQHDAQELLSFLLDGIHEDLNRVKKRPYIEGECVLGMDYYTTRSIRKTVVTNEIVSSSDIFNNRQGL